MNVVAYSLWGADPTYRVGALRNVELIAKHYGPAWVCRFYIFPSAADMADALTRAGAQVEMVTRYTEAEGLFARLDVVSDPTVQRFVVRDTDSRPSEREAELVREWVRSGKAVHAISDHRRHTAPLMGGMWGAVCSGLPEFTDALHDWVEAVRAGTAPYIRTAAGRYGRYSDQSFLGMVVWPRIRCNCLMHDTLSRDDLRDGNYFIGQQWHVVDGKEVPIWVN